ncbi:hypothetical protein LPJ74_006428 [Coemansia sp. RSA 1843]|nr:hypothetical protein LPJ74_006428 [Coemansia sp. RSA 1843]
MHHSSASVDLGALSSAFNVAQLSHTLSGQISPVGVQSTMASTMGVSQTQHLPHQYGIGVQPQDLIQPGLLHRNSVDMTGADNAVDDDEGDDEENSSEDTDKEAKGARKGSSNSGAVKCSTGKIKRPEAPYKRFRNSFIFFANERRKQWRREHPEVTKIQNRGFIQEMSKVWNSMSAEEKTPYMKMAEDDKLRYEADVKKYGPLPTNAQSASASSSGTGTTASTTPTALSMAQASSSVTASSLRGSEAGSVSLQASVPSVVPIAPAPAESAVSTPTAAPANNAIDVSVGSASINNAYANSNAAAVAAAAAAIAQPTPIAPAFIGSSHHLPVESFGVDSAVLGQHSYQMMLQQTFGQDFSPQAVEFDPSCFVGPDVQSADASTICFNPFSAAPTVNAESRQQHLQQLPAVSYDNSGTMIATGGASVPDTLSSNSNDGGTDASGSSSKAASANGPPITTLVGTKRKSSSDGQPMTSLPMSVKRFRNSFIYFVNARRQEMQFSRNGTPTNVEVNNREFLKEMSGKWRMMSEEEKAPYLKMADADKERFTREMREYELEHPEEFSKQSRHRRRRSSATSNGISAGIAGLDAMSAESSKLQSAAVAASMPFMPPSTAAYGLNISLTGIANSGSASPNGLLPFAQNAAGAFNSALALSSVPAEVMAHELNRAVATSVNTPISTAVSTPLTTPLLTPNAASLSDKTEMAQLSTGHFPSLPSVPEEVAVCTDAANSIAVASNVGVAGSTAGYLATAAKVATLPTVLEGADEDVNMN